MAFMRPAHVPDLISIVWQISVDTAGSTHTAASLIYHLVDPITVKQCP
jgi:hypothetical protein